MPHVGTAPGNGGIAMEKPNQTAVRTAVLTAAAILCAILARVLGKLGYATVTFGLIRTVIYIGLYTAFGISIRKRVVQAQVRRYLTAVSALMIFWFAVRTAKYYFVTDPVAARYLWYLYYLPMLFIPLFSVYVSISLGKPEEFRLPKWSLLFYIPTLLCLLLVLTNDLHRWVFTFPAGTVWSDKDYGYAVGYSLVFAWNVICALTAFVIMVVMSRKSTKEKYLPVIILSVSILYALIYAGGAEWMQLIGGDITAAQCLLFAGIFESCIRCGLIRVNTGYAPLFEAGTPGAQIADADYVVRYTSRSAKSFSADVMRAAESGAVRPDKNTLLKSHRIRGGHVLWQEDITEITALLERLEENKEKIAEGNAIERENYDLKLKINSAREKNRLYGLLQQQMARQIELVGDLMAQYDAEKDAEKRRRLLARTAVVGAYIKRRGNLMFLMENTETIDILELSRALDESFANIKLFCADCAVDCPTEGLLLCRDATRVYDFFEAVTEVAAESLETVWMKGRSLADAFVFTLEVVCGKSLAAFGNVADACTFEDGAWCFTLRVGKAGERQ